MKSTGNILVWLPVFNEKESIAFMIEELRRIGLDFVVCDGFSTDATIEIARSMDVKIVSRSGFGKGYAVRDGLAYAETNGYEGMVLIDCDQTYAVDDISKLTVHLSEYDMVVGNRDMSEMYVLRRWANHLMTFVINVLFNARVTDMASGLRLLRVDKFHSKLSAKSFDIEPQMYCVALGERYRVKQVEISYHERHGKSKVNIMHLILLIWRMIAERFRYLPWKSRSQSKRLAR